MRHYFLNKRIGGEKGNISTLILILFFITVLFFSARIFGLKESQLEKSIKHSFVNSMTNASLFMHQLADRYFK